MRVFRILALVLTGVGLFIQVTAYAAAQPAAPEPQRSSHCAEMAMSEQAPTQEDRNGCCDDMKLACFVGMNCIAPLLLPTEAADDWPAQLVEQVYPVPIVAALGAFIPRPEPPPPQSRS